MSDIKNINLSFNCPKTRESLDQTPNGYHCSDCSKEIIDFTKKNQLDFREIVEARKDKTCGVFRASQLSKNFVKYAAATALLGNTFIATAQEQLTTERDSVVQESELLGEIVFGEVAGNCVGINYSYPEPKGGMKKFYEALMGNIKYPDSLKVDGRTFLRILVDTTGSISNVEVIKGFDKFADEEAKRGVLHLDFPFIPANEKGKPIESYLIIPVNFKKNHE